MLTAELAAAYVRRRAGERRRRDPEALRRERLRDRSLHRRRRGRRARAARAVPARVREGGRRRRAWLVMSAYNSINGATVTENDLLETPLNSEWGFDGVVVSDWTAVRSLEAPSRRRTWRCPGRAAAWGDALVEAVRAGEIDEARHRPQGAAPAPARRPRRCARGFDAAGRGPRGSTASRSPARRRSRARCCCATTACCRWTPATLQRSPSSGTTPGTPAPRAAAARPCVPERVVSPLDGDPRRAARRRRHLRLGAVVQDGVAELPLDQHDQPGHRPAWLAGRASWTPTATEFFAEDRRSTRAGLFRRRRADRRDRRRSSSIRPTPRRVRHRSGSASRPSATAGSSSTASSRDDTAVSSGTDLGAALLSPPSISARST